MQSHNMPVHSAFLRAPLRLRPLALEPLDPLPPLDMLPELREDLPNPKKKSSCPFDMGLSPEGFTEMRRDS